MQEKRLRQLGGMMIEESRTLNQAFYFLPSRLIVLVNEFP